MENYVKREVDKYGTVRYYNSKGDCHRTNGPAVIWADGTKFWYKNGHWHRTNGPAVEYINGHKEWWINDKIYSKSYHNRLYLFYTLEPRIIDLEPTEDSR